MSTKASTAALDPLSERLSLPQRRAPRHPASGAQAQGYCGISIRCAVRQQLRTIRRRFLAGALMGGLTMVVPLIAAKAPVRHNELRMPLLDRRAIENLQRWASEENEREFECARLENRPAIIRFAPDPTAIPSQTSKELQRIGPRRP